MPRNVVTVIRRTPILVRRTARRQRQDEVLALLGERLRLLPREDGAGVEIAFPAAHGRREAKEQVVRELAALDAAWERLFKVYPAESALREWER